MTQTIEKIKISSAEDAAKYLEGGNFIRRKVSQKSIENMFDYFDKHRTFLEPVYISKTNGLHPHILNGQHRILAIQKYFEMHPTSKPVEIMALVEHDLTPEEETQIYAQLATQKSQSGADRILIQTQTAPVFKYLTKTLPKELGLIVKLHNATRKKAEFLYTNILLSYYFSRNGLRTIDNYEPVLEKMKNYNEADFTNIKFALMQYKHLHLEKEGVASHYRFSGTTYLRVFFFIYYHLRRRNEPVEIIIDIVQQITRDKVFWKLEGEFKHLRGEAQTGLIYNIMVKEMNKCVQSENKLPLWGKLETVE